MPRIVNACLVTDTEIIEDACVAIADDRVADVSRNPGAKRPDDVDLAGAFLVPGFLDIHVHPEEPEHPGHYRECITQLSAEMSSLGVAGILWAVANLPIKDLLESAAAVRDVLADPPPRCAVLGIHYEGPYFSPASRGAFRPEFLASPAELPPQTLLDAAGAALKYLSLAPDAPDADQVIRACVERGVRVGLGHSLAGFEIVKQCIHAGARSEIHTFNNTPTYPMKEKGVRGVTVDETCISERDVFNELICDGIHVDPVLVRLLRRAKGPDRVIIVTDSAVGGVERADGYVLQRRGAGTVVIRGRVGRDADGTMACSALTMPRAFKNYVRFTGATLPETVRATSLNAARFLGLDREFGRIAPGYRARFAVLDENLDVCMERLSGQ